MVEALLLPLLLSLLATPNSPSPRPAQEFVETRYTFLDDRQLADFEIRDGRWRTFGEALVCTSQGERDRIRWRRPLGRPTRLELRLLGAGPAGLLLQGEEHRLEVWFEPGEGRFEITLDGRELDRGFHEVRTPPRLDVSLWLEPNRLVIRPADDDPTEVPLGAEAGNLGTLELASRRGGGRFGELGIAQMEDPAQLREQERVLAVEIADRLSREGRSGEALSRIEPWLPESDPSVPARISLDDSTLDVLERIADGAEARRNPWIERLREESTRVSQDGSVALRLPFRSTWQGRAPKRRRLEGVLLEGRCEAPPLRWEVFRYDRRIDYWFGAEPRPVRLSGGSGKELAEARREDLLFELDRAVSREDPHEDHALGDLPTTWYALAYQPTRSDEGKGEDSAAPGPTHLLVEYFVLQNGHTLRFLLDGPESSFQDAAEGIERLLASFQLVSDRATHHGNR